MLDGIRNANSAMEVLDISTEKKLSLANLVADQARLRCLEVLSSAPVAIEVLIFDRSGELSGVARGW
jgi:hypothetical protein